MNKIANILKVIVIELMFTALAVGMLIAVAAS